ncbi:hypothetical protein [Streptomyces sp. NPDC058773]|uniref:hypothetical protein n=1 Tax=Streptomyces sp. NPDC058773 TaxID=3346632 RepID=UPI0036C05578
MSNGWCHSGVDGRGTRRPLTEHQSGEYLDQLAIMEFMDHLDPDPADDARRFYLVDYVHLSDANFENYYVFATPEQATVLEKELGLDLR